MTPTEFLLARITEDEALARAKPISPLHLACWSPARVLAECAAKREVVRLAWEWEVAGDGEWGDARTREQLEAVGRHPQAVLFLAHVYADHDDYDWEWTTP